MTEPVPTDPWSMSRTSLAEKLDAARAEVSRLTSALSTAEQLAQRRGQRELAALACAERAEAELERTREVVEAAKAWRKSMQPVILNGQLPGTRPQTRALVAAVDALRTDKEGADGP